MMEKKNLDFETILKSRSDCKLKNHAKVVDSCARVSHRRRKVTTLKLDSTVLRLFEKKNRYWFAILSVPTIVARWSFEKHSHEVN